MDPEVRHLVKQMPRGRETLTAQKALISHARRQGSDQCLFGNHAFQTDGNRFEPVRVYEESHQTACEMEGPVPEKLNQPSTFKSQLFCVTWSPGIHQAVSNSFCPSFTMAE